MARELRVEIVGDNDSLRRALGSAGKSADTFGSKMQKMGRVVGIAALGAGAAIAGGLVVTLKRGFDELADSQKVAAQTAAAIKSTGAAANVTEKQVSALATALSKMSGVDDEAIQASQNLLLGFTNVRNEVGKGNDIFNQASKAALNLSVRTGKGLNPMMVALGKALADPIKGMGGLAKAGVKLDEATKKQITTLAEHGKSLEAQKLVLKAVEDRVGGAAKAYGDTLPGQLNKAKNAFDEIAGNLAVKFLPVLTQLLDWVNNNWASISAVFDAVGTAIVASFKAIGVAVTWLRGQWEIHRATAIATWTAIQSAVQKTIAWIQTNVVPPIAAVIQAAIGFWNRFGDSIKQALSLAITIIKTDLALMIAPFKIFFDLLRGDWSKAWNDLKSMLSTLLNAIVTVIQKAAGLWLTAAKALGKAILDGVVAGLSALAGKVWGELSKIFGVITDVASVVYGFAKAIGSQLVNGIWDGIKGLLGGLKKKIEDGLGFLKSLNPFSTVRQGGEKYIGKPIMDGAGDGVEKGKATLEAKTAAAVRAAVANLGPQIKAATNALGGTAVQQIIDGVAGKQPTLAQQLKTALVDATKAALAAQKQAVLDAKAGLASAFGALADAALAAFDKINSAQTKAQKELARMQAEDAKKAVDDQVKAAQDALQAAQNAAAAIPPIALGQTESPEAAAARKKAEDDLLAAQQQLTAALRAQKEAELAVTIQSEQDKLAAKRAAFEEDLAQLETWTQNHSKKHKELLERIKKLWEKYGVLAKGWGRNLGDAIAQGLRDSLENVRKAAQELADAVKGNTKGGSPTKEGPLSTYDPKDAGFDYAASWAKGFRMGVGNLNFGGMDVRGMSAARGSGSQPIIHTHVYLDKREIALAVSQQNPRLARAGYALS